MRHGFCGLRSNSRDLLRELIFATYRERQRGANDLPYAPARDPRGEPGGWDRRWLEEARAKLHAARGQEQTEVTDLLDEPALDPEDRSWLEEAREAVVQRDRDTLALAHCERETGPRGYVALAVFDESSTREARKGDAVIAGFSAYRPAGGQLVVQPRIYRVLCTNGLVLGLGTEADVASRAASVRAAIDSCLSPVRFERDARTVARVAAIPLESPNRLLAEVRDVAVRADARREWGRAGDRTVWGAVNALTASARNEPHFGRRLELERLAGVFLAAHARRPRVRGVRALSPQLS